MRRIILFLLFSYSFWGKLSADEGMYNIPISKSLYNTLKGKGLSLSIDDICGDKSSLKDAVVMFGNGGTGVIVSDKGLLLTNYHLASRFIPPVIQNSSDFVQKGYYAKNAQEEIPIKNLYIRFQIKEIDITSYILKNISLLKSQKDKQNNIKLIISQYIKDNTPKEIGLTGEVKEVNGGNKYIFYLHKTYNDIRLVAIPPKSLAKLGGEKFNWEWPRYSADFAMFRIYSDEKNAPTNYSVHNIPYKPLKVIPLSSEKISENDFTMVIGFPGSTYFSESSSFVKNIILESNARRIPLINYKLSVVQEFMYKSDLLYNKYYPIYSSLNNDVKNREGLSIGLNISNGINRKISKEDIIKQKIYANNDLYQKYISLLDTISSVCLDINEYMVPYDYIRSGILATDLLNIAYTTYTKLIKRDSIDIKTRDNIMLMIKKMYDSFDPKVDREIFPKMLCIYRNSVSPRYIPKMWDNNKISLEDICDNIYSNSVFTTYKKMQMQILHEPKKILDDPAIKFVVALDSLLDKKIIRSLISLEIKMDSLKREYQSMNYVFEKNSWVDANKTLRLSYGNVTRASNKTANFHTNHVGLIQEIVKEKDPYISVSPIIYNILKTYDQDYTINFITNCHTTGGNSGSPVLNQRGELIGLNFDRIKEGVVGDYVYDASLCRNISLSTSYILYILDKVGNAENIINELNISQK